MRIISVLLNQPAWLLLAGLVVWGSGCRAAGAAAQGSVRFVAAAKPSGRDVAQVRHSVDGLAWSMPREIVDGSGTSVSAVSSVGIAFDGRLYHAAWFDAVGRLRYATSGNGDNWLASAVPLGSFPVGPGAQPAVAAGAGKVLVAFRQGGSILVLDVTSPSAVAPAPGSASGGPALAFGDGRFVLAFPSRAPSSTQVRVSADGRSWTASSALPTGSYPPGAVALAYDAGQFQLVHRLSVSTGSLSRVDLETHTSTDGLTWTAGDTQRGFPNGTGMAVSRRGPGRLLLDAATGVNVFVGTAAAQAVNFTAINGLGITRGRGRPVVTFTLDSVTVTDPQENSGDEPYFLLFSFHSRVASPGSTRVYWSGALEKVGSDLGRGATQTIRPSMGATAWTVEQARDLGDSTNGQVDIMGAIIVALEEDACPRSGVADKANQAVPVIRGALETLIAGGTLATLLDKPSRDAAVAAATTSVRNTLGGGSAFKSFFGCATDRDDQIQDRIVIFVGTEFFTEDPASRTFAVVPTRPVLPISIPFRDSETTWTVAARMRVN